MSQKSGLARRTGPHRFTEKQGEYLAFIYLYARMVHQAPAEADMQRHFRVSPSSVHQMPTLSRVVPSPALEPHQEPALAQSEAAK